MKKILKKSLLIFGIILLGRVNSVKADELIVNETAHTITIDKEAIEQEDGNVSWLINVAIWEAQYRNAENKELYTIIVPTNAYKGTSSYKVNSTIRMESNITLDVTGCTLTNSGNPGNLVVAGSASQLNLRTWKEYKAFENITIKGGTWVGDTRYKDYENRNTASIFRFSHMKNLTLDGVTVTKGCCNHQMEVMAIDGFYVKNSTFKDFEVITNSKGVAEKNQEALQIDVCCSASAFRYESAEGETYYLDGTPCKNIEITGCTFENLPRGVGTHTMLAGSYIENVNISNNTFKKIKQEAIVCVNYYNCTISKNKIEDCGAGILVQSFKSLTEAKGNSSVYTTIGAGAGNGIYKTYSEKNKFIKDLKITIEGNTIKISNYKESDELVGIKVYGRDLSYATDKTLYDAEGKLTLKSLTNKNYYIGGITVKKNKITTPGYGIHLMDARNCKIDGNEIDGSRQTTSSYDGINIGHGSKAVSVTNNTVKNCKRNGIAVFGVCLDGKNNTGSEASSITGNTVGTVSACGITVSTGCKVTGKIAKNTITASKDAAIQIYSKSSAAGGITDNILEKGVVKGIAISTSSSCGAISDNTIKSPSNIAILIYLDSSAGSIANNTISSCKEKAISVTTRGKAKDITNNKITCASTSEQGILIYNKSTVTGAVTKNFITGGKISSLSVSTNSQVKEITGNTIKDGKQGLCIINPQKSLSVKDNTISCKNANTISVNTGSTSKVVTFTGNTITGNGTNYGIYVSSGAANIKDNTFSKGKAAIKYTPSTKGVVETNTYKSYSSKPVLIATNSGDKGFTNLGKGTVSSLSSSKKANLTAKWKKVANADTYEVQYATDSKFTKNLKTNSYKASSLKFTKDVTSKTYTGLKSGTTYYVRVRAVKKVENVTIYGKYSDVVKKKLK